MGQIYNVPFSPGGGTDFTADAGTGADCVGAWLIFDDDNEDTSVLDRCPEASQNGVDDMVWDGANWGRADPPVGTVAGGDSVDIVAGGTEWFSLADALGVGPFEAPSFTTGCWINSDDLADQLVIIGKNDVPNWELRWRNDAGDYIWAEVVDVSEWGAAAAANEWHHVVMRYDGAVTQEIEVLVDGELMCGVGCTAQLVAPTGDDSPVRIGASQLGGNEYDGQMMECFYFDAALTDTELAEIFLCGLQGDANGWLRDTTYGGAQCSAISTCCS